MSALISWVGFSSASQQSKYGLFHSAETCGLLYTVYTAPGRCFTVVLVGNCAVNGGYKHAIHLQETGEKLAVSFRPMMLGQTISNLSQKC